MADAVGQKKEQRYARELRDRRRAGSGGGLRNDLREQYEPYGDLSILPGQDPLEAAVYDPYRDRRMELGPTLAEQAEVDQPKRKKRIPDQAYIEQELRRQFQPLQQAARRQQQALANRSRSLLSQSDIEAYKEIADFEKKRVAASSLLSVQFAAVNLARKLREVSDRSGMGPGLFIFVLVISVAFDLKDYPVEVLQDLFAASSIATAGLTTVLTVGVWLIDTIGATAWVLAMWFFFAGRSNFITRRLFIYVPLVLFMESIPLIQLFTGYTMATILLKRDLDKQQHRLRSEADAIDREVAALPAESYG